MAEQEMIMKYIRNDDGTFNMKFMCEVVRCKDCLHNRACEIQYHAQAGDLFFCGAAERKDGDHHG